MAISDIVNPQVLGAIVGQKIANILPTIPALDTSNDFPTGSPGTSWELPYNGIIAALGEDGIGTTLTPQQLTQGVCKSVVQRGGQAYKDSDIEKMVAKDNPADALTQDQAMDKIVDEFAGNIAGVTVEYLLNRRIAVLEGAIPSANRYDGSAAVLSAAVIRAAKLKLGDKGGKLKYALINSKVYNDLDTNGQIIWQPANAILPLYGTQVVQLGSNGAITSVPTCGGCICVQTDAVASVATSPTKYPTYLMSEKAMGLWYQRNLTIEYERHSLADGGYTSVTARIDFVLGVHGVSYTESTSPQLYTLAAIKNTANYTLKWNQKNVGIVRVLSL
jgi:hypothetical protein